MQFYLWIEQRCEMQQLESDGLRLRSAFQRRKWGNCGFASDVPDGLLCSRYSRVSDVLFMVSDRGRHERVTHWEIWRTKAGLVKKKQSLLITENQPNVFGSWTCRFALCHVVLCCVAVRPHSHQTSVSAQIWIHAMRHQLRAATFFWPSSEVAFNNTRPNFYKSFNK